MTSILNRDVIRVLKPKQDNYAHQKEIERREAEKRAKAEADAFQKQLDKKAKAAGVAPVKMETRPVVKADTGPVKTQSGTMSTKMVWDFEIVDPASPALFKYVLTLFKAEYIKLATRALKKGVKAGVIKMNGVRYFERAETTHRTR